MITAGVNPEETAAKMTAGGLLLFRNLFQLDTRLLELFPFKDEAGQPIEEVRRQ